MRRLRAAAFLALAAVAASSPAAAEAALTPRNSLVAPLLVADSVSIEGVGCGVPASATIGLPSGAVDVRVRGRRSAPGARTRAHRACPSRATPSLHRHRGRGAICDPGAEATPPANRPGRLLRAEVAYRQRVGVVHRDADRPRGRSSRCARGGPHRASPGPRPRRALDALRRRARPSASAASGPSSRARRLQRRRNAPQGASYPARPLPGLSAARPQGGRRLLQQGRLRPRERLGVLKPGGNG